MPDLLHILTKPNDTLALEIISHQRQQPGTNVEVVDLTQPEPDYKALLDQIFAADSVAVW
jgi:hypothetical protein